MQPTYTTKEALLLMLDLDLQGLEILIKLLNEEMERYSTVDLKRIKRAWVWCALSEYSKQGLL